RGDPGRARGDRAGLGPRDPVRSARRIQSPAAGVSDLALSALHASPSCCPLRFSPACWAAFPPSAGGIAFAAVPMVEGTMKAIVILTAIVVALVGAGLVGAQDNKDTNKDTTKDRGGIGGVLDTLGGILGGATSSKLHGTVVVAHDTNVVLRTDDKKTVRVDTASIDPQVRQQLAPGQSVTITTRGSGDVLTASDVQVEQGKASPQAFSRVSGTVQERSDGRILFKTKEGLTLPVDTSQVRGLPYIAPNTPATLMYEQGSKQEVRAVWI